jgi:hypothetical protein
VVPCRFAGGRALCLDLDAVSHRTPRELHHRHPEVTQVLHGSDPVVHDDGPWTFSGNVSLVVGWGDYDWSRG